jgi:S1-C subfamily serine protease
VVRRALAILTLSSAILPTRASAQANATAPVATVTQAACSARWVEEIYPNVRRSVVRIHTVGGIGSGFIFGDERHVATAFHVVAIGRPLEVHLSNDEVRTGSVVAVDPEHDLAVLELDAPAPFPPLPAATSREGPAIGAEVVVVGHPLSGARGPQALPSRAIHRE